MRGVGIIGAIVVGLLAGWIAEKVMNREHGLLTNLVVGLLGALVGPIVLGSLHLMPVQGGFWPSLLISTIGAIVLLFLLGLIKRA
ncbi:GlsB/YeaQ/YmgE family stress response membrane protein [Chelatococcus sp. SYSU_G07232]|uniref:GlsB/YeaQ/YmgE family stress response membrane protein n=1 Tax=Chelatococcus albus TaxID=3047466 RepID=A0ABT7AE13_9HYPH|nr:GlsB/YeaQ/YmgE family stress response membrane protein [Chelatococcus sp. SYSU_G07232]MDJ1156836.1 GlsB/YeaQ/YmgE family stress response membrane protein [Chelatococcus sp. SYSU_G07232]